MKNNRNVCAACRHHKRKCPEDCPLLPYFPLEKHQQFMKAHKHFGVSNIVKHLQQCNTQSKKDIAMETMLFEAEAHYRDPVGGCYRILCELDEQIEYYQSELNKVLDQIRVCKGMGLRSEWGGEDRGLGMREECWSSESDLGRLNDDIRCRVKTERNDELNIVSYSGNVGGLNSFWHGENGYSPIVEGSSLSSSSSSSDVGQNQSFLDMLNAPMEYKVKIEHGEETGAEFWTEETKPKIF